MINKNLLYYFRVLDHQILIIYTIDSSGRYLNHTLLVSVVEREDLQNRMLKFFWIQEVMGKYVQKYWVYILQHIAEIVFQYV